jgi:hypothetical protein
LHKNLGYFIVFLQKWIATKEKFEKLISVGAFFFPENRSALKDEQKRKQKGIVMADSHAKDFPSTFASSSHNLKKTF